MMIYIALLHKRLFLGSIAMLILLVSSFLLSACATPPTVSTSNNPLGLLEPGTLLVASDTSNPPMEYIDDTTQQTTGFDIDLITAIAHRLHLKITILNTKIELLMSDLANKRYDVAISAIPITPDRQAEANLIPYYTTGESLLVQASNPHRIRGLADLCGQAVGVQDSSLAQVDLQNASDTCQQAGKPAIAAVVLKNQMLLIQLLAEGRVVSTFQDSSTSDYFMKLYPGQFTLGSSVLKASDEGIAVNEENGALTSAIQNTLNTMKNDGTYGQLIEKWGNHAPLHSTNHR
jgi:ABC-type amino acid transport substrate-binding protein